MLDIRYRNFLKIYILVDIFFYKKQIVKPACILDVILRQALKFSHIKQL